MTSASIMVRRALIEPVPRWVTDGEVGDYPLTVYCQAVEGDLPSGCDVPVQDEVRFLDCSFRVLSRGRKL